MIHHSYLIIILSFTGTGNSNCDNSDKNIKQLGRVKRSSSTLNGRTFKSVIVYNDAITLLSTSTWPRYIIDVIKPRNKVKVHYKHITHKL